MLSSEVGPFAEQLALRQGEDAGSLSNQHRIVQATVARSRWDQVTALKNTHREKSNKDRHSAHRQDALLAGPTIFLSFIELQREKNVTMSFSFYITFIYPPFLDGSQ